MPPPKAHIKNFVNRLLRLTYSLNRPSGKANRRLLQQHGESLNSIRFRFATAEDIAALAALHVKTWNQTYWPVKNPPAVSLREHQWRQLFTVPGNNWFCIVVEKQEELIGFALGKSYRSNELPEYSGELNKIYLLREYHGLGLGGRLLQFVAREFLSRGIHSMVLFATPQNPSGRFHEAMGGKKIYAANGEFHGAYGWTDLSTIAGEGPPLFPGADKGV